MDAILPRLVDLFGGRQSAQKIRLCDGVSGRANPSAGPDGSSSWRLDRGKSTLLGTLIFAAGKRTEANGRDLCRMAS